MKKREFENTKKYKKPELSEYGDIKNITKGTAPGGDDTDFGGTS